MAVNDRKVSLKTKQRPTESVSRADEVSPKTRRSRVGGRSRFIPHIEGMDPNFVYRFIKDVVTEIKNKDGSVVARPGQRIIEFQDAAWQFVKKDEVRISDTLVYDTQNMGSIIRIPGGLDEYLYLMKIEKRFFDEDQEAKLDQIRETEMELGSYANQEGSYGSVKFE